MSRETARRAVQRAVDLAAPGNRTKWCTNVAGIDPKTLRSFLRGDRWPGSQTRLDIERALGWEPGWISAMEEAPDDQRPETTGSVPAAIRADTALLPEVREFLLEGYYLMLRLQAMPRAADEERRLNADLEAEMAEAAAEREIPSHKKNIS